MNRACAQAVVDHLYFTGLNVSFGSYAVRNMTAHFDTGKPILLTELWRVRHGSLEPELFPNLVIRLKDSGTVALVYNSGKVVLTGAKSKEQIDAAHTDICASIQMVQ